MQEKFTVQLYLYTLKVEINCATGTNLNAHQTLDFTFDTLWQI